MNPIGPILLQIVLIFLNAVFAMAEIAVISISEAKLQKLEAEGDKRARRLIKLKSQPAKFLATIQVAITLSGFLGSAFAAENFSKYFISFFDRYFPSVSPAVVESCSVVIITLILSYVSLIFGELVPKRIAMRKSEGTALGLSATVYTVSRVFAPVVWFLTVSTNGVLRLLGIDPNADDEEVSEEDILMMAEVGSEKGVIEEEEREMIENIFEFDDLTVGAVAVHRTDVTLLWTEESDKEWDEIIRNSRYTVYPVCDGSIDNIIGVLDTKDYFRLENKSRKNVMEKAVRPPYFVPEGAKADLTFRNMKKSRVSFAVVLDEYAGFYGIVSMKDLIEQIVGDMDDEDEKAEEEEIVRLNERQWRVSGGASLALLSKELGVDFPDNYETLGGFVLSLYGAVPEDGSDFSVEYEGIEIVVADVQEHQVTHTVLTLPEKEADEDGE